MSHHGNVSVPPPESWWPLVVVVLFGAPLAADAWGWVRLEDWVHSGLVILFAASVAAFLLGDVFRFLLWWFFRRHE